MDITTRIRIKYTTAYATIALTHLACLGSGIYNGVMRSRGVEAEIPFRELWGANILGTGIGSAIIDSSNTINNDKNTIMEIGRKRSRNKNVAIGTTVGAVAAPIEYMVGTGIGWVIDKAIL